MQSRVSIAFKVLAIYLGVEMFSLLTQGVVFHLSSTNPHLDGGYVDATIHIGIGTLVAAALWLLSNPLAKLAVRQSKPAATDEETTSNTQWFQIGIAVLGLYFVGSQLPQIITLPLYFEKVSDIHHSFTIPATKSVLGLIMVIGSNGLPKLIFKLKAFGLNTKAN